MGLCCPQDQPSPGDRAPRWDRAPGERDAPPPGSAGTHRPGVVGGYQPGPGMARPGPRALGTVDSPPAAASSAPPPSRPAPRPRRAGTPPVPAWLDQPRELSEQWIHRQQLLQALGRPNDLRPDLAGPVLDGLRWACPYRLKQCSAGPGDTVTVAISGPVARTGCSTLKWPHCGTSIWPHPGRVG